MGLPDDFAPGDALRSVDILYVDDESHRRDGMRRLLLSLGARSVQLTEPGPSAVKVAIGTACGLVIVEHRTAPMDGIAFVRQLRAVGNYPRALVPAMIVGDPVGVDVVKTALAAGANHFLVKPLSPAKLYERVAWAIADNRPFAVKDGHYVFKTPASRPSAGPAAGAARTP